MTSGESNNRPTFRPKGWGLFQGLLKFSELEYSCGIKFLGADVLSLPILSFEEIGPKKIMGL